MEHTIKISKTPQIIRQEYQKFKTDDYMLQRLIDDYVIGLEKELSEENMQLLYNNMSTLTVENKRIFLVFLLSLFNDSIVTGLYYLEDNKISLLPIKNKKFLNNYLGVTFAEYIAILYHELMHMSSTVVDELTKYVFSGFWQSAYVDIGVALDDGYTEILLYRFFDLDEEYMSFDYEIAITLLVEKIVSRTKMIDLYFKADLYGLVNELQKYNTLENIIKFLKDFDFIYDLEDHLEANKSEIVHCHNEIVSFLVETYKNKLKTALSSGKMTETKYNKKIGKFINKLDKAFDELGFEKEKIKKL